MRIEHYSDQFREDVIELIEKFHVDFYQQYDEEIYRPTVEQTIESLKQYGTDKAFLLINDEDRCVGFIAGHELKSYINDTKMYSELFFFINQPYGRYVHWFIHRVEQMLKAQGYKIMVMAVLKSEKAARIEEMYRNIGYRHLETHYIKNL